MSSRADDRVVYRPGEVVILTVDNPPANTLSTAVLAALEDVLDEIAAAPAVRCLVLAARGRQFVAGGDVHELLAAVGDAQTDHLVTVLELFRRAGGRS